MKRKVFIAGATGYTGRVLLSVISASPGWEAIAQVRPSSRHAALLPDDLPRAVVDPSQVKALVPALSGCEAVATLIGTRWTEFAKGGSYEEVDVATTKALVTAATKARVEKFVLLSAIGASHRGTPYQRAKWQCENLVRASLLSWVILQPSFIVGPERRVPQVLT